MIPACSSHPSRRAHSTRPDVRSRSRRRAPALAQPRGELLQGTGDDVVVRPQAATLRIQDPGRAKLSEVVGERRLGDVEQGHELADADLAGMAAQHVDELQAYRVA